MILLRHEKSSIMERCRVGTEKVCRESRLDFEAVTIYMIQGVDYSTPAPTINILVEDTTQKGLWKSTLIRVSRLLKSEDALDLHVLISCSKLPVPKYIFAVEKAHPLVKLWPEKLLIPVIDILEGYKLKYSVVEVLRYGTRRDAASPTILVTVEDDHADRATWYNAELKITNLCRAHGQDLRVELREERSTLRRVAETATGRNPDIAYNEKVFMGGSVGVEKKAAGTMGGYLRLESVSTGESKIIGITNYNVVRGSGNWWQAGKLSK